MTSTRPQHASNRVFAPCRRARCQKARHCQTRRLHIGPLCRPRDAGSEHVSAVGFRRPPRLGHLDLIARRYACPCRGDHPCQTGYGLSAVRRLRPLSSRHIARFQAPPRHAAAHPRCRIIFAITTACSPPAPPICTSSAVSTRSDLRHKAATGPDRQAALSGNSSCCALEARCHVFTRWQSVFLIRISLDQYGNPFSKLFVPLCATDQKRAGR